MKKHLLFVFLIALAYFFVIIPVQSQNQNALESWSIETVQPELFIDWSWNSVDNFWLEIILEETWEIIQENPNNDTGQNAEIKENFIESITWSENTINGLENNFTDDTTWQVPHINQTPQIIISEVHFDWTDEWVEITNIWDYFSGDLILFISKEISLSLELQSKQSIIVAKPSIEYLWISPIVQKYQSTTSFSITDTKVINILLQRSWQILDSFYVETWFVAKLDNKKMSFVKVYNNQIWSISGATNTINVLSPYIATPWIWESLSNFVWEDQNQGTWLSGNTENPDQWPSSWLDFGGGTLSGIVEIPTPSFPQTGILSITEIFNWTLQFSSFIEIKALQDFSWKVFLSGSLLKASLELDLLLKNQEYIIVVQFDNWWLSDQKIIENINLEQGFSWFLQIYGQSGQVFDTIQILSTSWNKSNYNWDFSNWDIDIFSKIDRFSPWFDEKFLYYFDVNFSYITWQNNQILSWDTQTLTWAVSTTWIDIWPNLSWYISTWWLPNYQDLFIDSLNHLNPESITIKSNLDINLDLSKKDRYLLTKETEISPRKTTKKYLTGILLWLESITINKTRWFLDKGSCVGLFYQAKQVDEFCYSQFILEKPKEEDIKEKEENNYHIPDIKIIWLIPNPSGKDDKEELHLLRNPLWSWSVTESSVFNVVTTGNEAIQPNIFQLPPKSLYILHNTTKKYLSGTLRASQETIFTGSLWLLNKTHCFELRYFGHKLDRFCYQNPKEDQYFGTWNYILQTIQKSDFNILQKVWFTVMGSKICVSYYDQLIVCHSLPYSKTSIRLKNENKLYKIYFGLFQNYLIKNWSTLYYNTDIKIYFDTFKKAKAEVSKFGHVVSISGQQFNTYDISWQIELTTASQWLSWKQFQEQKSWRKRFLLRLGL